MADPRVVIVGTGPAGVRAAETLLAGGLIPTVIDEGRDGGQIYRRQPTGFSRDPVDVYGADAAKAAGLHAAFEAIAGRVDYRPDTVAWGLWDNRVHLASGDRSSVLAFDRLIIAAGATDRLMPVDGWERAGVFTLGGAQIALKSQAVSIGRRLVFMGTGPLLYLVAWQYMKAGAEVAAVLDSAATTDRLRGLPRLLARPDVLARGRSLVRDLRAAGVELRAGITPLEIEGSDADGVSGVRYACDYGRERTVACDAVAMGYHLRPSLELADLARCELRFDATTRQFMPVLDGDGRSSVPGVYLAGDGARLVGADGAELSGRLAGLAVLADCGRAVPQGEMARLRRALTRHVRFRDGLATAFPWPAHLARELSDDTVLCRCESVTVGELREAVSVKGGSEVNRAKAFSRVGMGRCQGRYCGHAAAEVIAASAGIGIEQVGRLRAQAPVKPLALAIGRTEEGAS
ncbi:MAG: FAD/NAD(P)-binding oxidoreductase [Rhizobiales bacterium]|nr:FAD/NAD(P)-binding oxidoreductase [Hyphomicrobiales bacterium]